MHELIDTIYNDYRIIATEAIKPDVTIVLGWRHNPVQAWRTWRKVGDSYFLPNDFEDYATACKDFRWRCR